MNSPSEHADFWQQRALSLLADRHSRAAADSDAASSELPTELARAETSVNSLENYVNGSASAPDLDPTKMKKQSQRLRSYIDKARDIRNAGLGQE